MKENVSSFSGLSPDVAPCSREEAMSSCSARCLFLALVLCLPAAVRADEPGGKKADPTRAPLAGLDDYVAGVMKEWHVPGLALGVVKDGKVLLVKGYGMRDVEKKLPVTERTLFAIGSISKSFTVVGLGMLVDEKKLDWDKPVRDYLGDFRLHDRVPGERVTPRDLVAHRTGLPRHDALWYATKLNRRQMYERLRYLEPTKDLRQTWQYNNLMFLVAGLLQEKVSGQTWEEFTRQRILAPLGMKRTNLSVDDSQKADDFALPYDERDGKVKRVPFRNIDAVAPAGSINSSVEDMTRYLLFQLALGKHDGKQLLSRGQAEEMQSAQMVLPLAMQKQILFYAPGESSYGLGLVVSRHRGEPLIHHSGGIDGFISYMALLPRQKAGVIVLTNLAPHKPAMVPMVVGHEVLDRLLGQSDIDWRQRNRQQRELIEKLRGQRKSQLERDRQRDTHPSHPLAELAGTYQHPAYGKLRVTVADKDLEVAFEGAKLPVQHYHHNTFVVVDRPDRRAAMLEDHQMEFRIGKKGAVDRVEVEMENGVARLSFQRAQKKEEGEAKR
jgi:CubicO group peptidase (beta-lactamase class C family)